MAVVAGVLNEVQRRTLEAVCDTYVPSVETDHADPVLRDYFARPASDLRVAAHIEDLMAQAMMPAEIAGFAELLDAFAEHDFANLPLATREQILRDTATSSHEAKLGVHAFKNLTLLFFYALPDANGQNPNWAAIGFPGPLSAPPSADEAPKTIPVEQVSGESALLEADVCVVGSGAGGAVIAAELQRAGKRVLVLELGPYQNEQDFKQLELVGLLELYYRGGLFSSEDGSIAIFAGSALGGGTIVNYMNCLRTPDAIRREWADFGLEGVDTPDYDAHLDAVMERISATADATSQNRQHRKLIQALDALGIEHRPIVRNVDASCDDPRVCGYCSGGCQKGCKQSTMKTFLQDAADAGARFVVGAYAERIVSEDGRASGVEATVRHADGSTTALRVEAPCVVCACGSTETPALLLRSGIGGPAVGKNLRLHPAGIVVGRYEEPIEGWIGQIQSEVSDHFAAIEGEQGFLIESVGMGPGINAMSWPWVDGAQHKQLFSSWFRFAAPFLCVDRDHGSGEVVLDEYDRALVRWSLDDEIDRRIFIRANVELAKLHRTAGAEEIMTMHHEPLIWKREHDDFDEFIARVESASYDAADVAIFTAHQLGSCRMGSDPAQSVADGRGELHDTKGVWIGDASAFPTASGVNPMVSIMALARRTAGKIASA